MRPAFLELLKKANLDPKAVTPSIVHTQDGTLKCWPTTMHVKAGESEAVEVPIEPITALFVGTRQPPSFHPEPPEEYLLFFGRIEIAAALACAVMKTPTYDSEFERLYRQLRRFPDGTDKSPLFGVLQQAAALHASIEDVSRAEYEAVMDRLSRSARTFGGGAGSTNYYKNILVPLLVLQ